LAACLVTLLLCACDDPEMGYIELRPVQPKLADQPTLYVGSTKLDPFKGTRVLLRVPTGKFALADSGWFASGWFRSRYCEILVRKNRISIVNVRLADDPPRCECLDRAPVGTTDMPVCM
jgi:hypothetical protein